MLAHLISASLIAAVGVLTHPSHPRPRASHALSASSPLPVGSWSVHGQVSARLVQVSAAPFAGAGSGEPQDRCTDLC